MLSVNSTRLSGNGLSTMEAVGCFGGNGLSAEGTAGRFGGGGRDEWMETVQIQLKGIFPVGGKSYKRNRSTGQNRSVLS